MQARRRKRHMNPIAGAIILFIFGTLAALSAIAIDSNNVTCDGEKMNAGDTCLHYKNGAITSKNTIDQERQSQEVERVIATIFSIVLFGGGILCIVGFVKSRVASQRGVAQSGNAQQSRPYLPSQGGYPQQPGAYPPPQNNYPQQPGGYPPQYPQQPGAYPPPQSAYPQQPRPYSPQGAYPQAGRPVQPGYYPPTPPYRG